MEKQEIRKLLEQKEVDLLHKLGQIESDALRNPLSADSEDRSQELENEDVLNELDSVESKELMQVRFALKRLESGEYGSCSDCGSPIADARLKAIPYANVCIDCAKEAEQSA